VGRSQPPTLLTTAEAAALLRVHPKHVYRLLRRGLPAHRVGGEWRFRGDELLAWAAVRGVEAGAGTPDAGESRLGDLGSRPSLLAANGDVVVETLLAEMHEHHSPLLGLVQADRGVALDLLRRGEVLVAGYHGEEAPARPGGEPLVHIHLADRDVGLASRKSRRRLGLEELVRTRLADRPPTAGVRVLLDAELEHAGIETEKVHARGVCLASHRDVVLAVAGGEADVGMTTAAWAARLGLSFVCLANEPYSLVARARDLGDVRLAALCRVAESRGFRQRLRAIPGYDLGRAGDIRYVKEAALRSVVG